MSLFNITIEKVIVKNNYEEIIKLLKEIKCLVSGADADQQMDSWLLKLKESVEKIEQVSDTVK